MAQARWQRLTISRVAQPGFRRPRAGIPYAALGLTALLTAALWAVLLPFNHAPDEADHLQLATYIAEHAALPVYDVSPGIRHTSCAGPAGPCVGSYGSLPPAAPLLSAALMALAHAATGTPYQQLLLPARLGSVLAYAVFAILLAAIATTVFRDRRVAWTAALLGSFIPQVVFVGAYVDDDAFGMAAAAGLIYCAVLLLDRSRGWWFAVLAGVAAGLVVLAKLTSWVVLPAFAAAAAFRLIQDARAGRGRISALMSLATLAVALVVSGWWLARNWLLYRDFSGSAVIFRAFERAAPAYQAHSLAGQGHSFFYLLHHTDWILGSYLSFWGYFDYLSLRMPAGAYIATIAVCFVAVLGAAVRLVEAVRPDRRLEPVDWRVLALLAGVAMVAILLSAWTSYTNDYQAQGRYLFAALAPAALLIAGGLHSWSQRLAYRSALLGIACVAAPLFAAYALVFVIVPAYYSFAT